MTETQNLYDTLDVSQNATAEELKTAYRKAARDTHLDRHPDKADRFKKVSEAYSVLSIPDRRKRYDETGSTSAVPEGEAIRQQAIGHIAAMLQKVVADLGNSIFEKNIVEAMVQNCVYQEDKLSEVLKKTGKECARWKRVRRKISFSGESNNVMTGVCDDEIRRLKGAIDGTKTGIKVMKKSREMLSEYGWEYVARESRLLFGEMPSTASSTMRW